MMTARAFTAVAPEGKMVPSMTRLSRRSVQLAIRARLAESKATLTTFVTWDQAKKLGWKVAAVYMHANEVRA